MVYLGVDTGGTFTDFVMVNAGKLTIHKVLSTPSAPEQAILQGIEELAIKGEFILVHGSTVATNAVLEGKGVKTLYVCNRGFEDVLTIGRQNRKQLYHLQARPDLPPVPDDLCLGIGGRVSSEGQLLEPISDSDLQRVLDVVLQSGCKAVAVNLLFSWLLPELEQKIGKQIPDNVFVALSSEVLPEIRECERGIATWLNAWIGPVVSKYLAQLGVQLAGKANISIMQSSGTTIAADKAGHEAVRMLLSGPAGGLSGSHFMAANLGIDKMLTFDMGGTSADVALIDGKPSLTTNGKIASYPVAVPMVDIHTIGAGGGSQAYLDDAGMLHVGPQSAGADPGPACYGKGGNIPTVTDANLLLGRLLADRFLGGNMTLDIEAARRAVGRLAKKMECQLEVVARGIVDIANEHMVRALRVISVERGYDPAKFTLVSFGGAGGLHACALAEALSCQSVLMPAHGGVLSALGMLVTPPGRHLSRTRLGLICDFSSADIQGDFDVMVADGRQQIIDEGVAAKDIQYHCLLDVRYSGQSSTLAIAWSDIDTVIEQFNKQHVKRFGHAMDTAVELVNLRVEVVGRPTDLTLSDDQQGSAIVATQFTEVFGQPKAVPVVARDDIVVGQKIKGPCLVTETITTSWIPSGWIMAKDSVGNLLLQHDIASLL